MQRSTLIRPIRKLSLPIALAIAVWLLASGGLHGHLVMAQLDASHVGNAAPNHAGLGAADVVVEVSGMTFSPTIVTIEPGQTITWMRRSGFHNVAADDGSYRSGEVSDMWDTFSHTFVTTGEYPYHCELHGGAGGVGMAGKIIVQVSGQSGSKLFLPILAH